MTVTWTTHPESATLEQMTASLAGLKYIIPGYTRHATDDAGKLADEREWRAYVEQITAE